MNQTAINRPVKRASAGVVDQLALERAIISYQNSIAANAPQDTTVWYQEICRIYQPMRYINKWWKYRPLYDSREDFVQDYLHIFCKTIAKWKPRDERGESKYGGKGLFMGYFWSALQKYYANLVKAESASKRSTAAKCPICEAECQPLSTHLFKHHEHLLWERMAEFGHDPETLKDCPFCSSFKSSKKVVCEHQETGACEECLTNAHRLELRKHLLSNHSTYLFERFHQLFPQQTTLSSKPASVYGQTDHEEETNLYENTAASYRLEHLLAHNLTDVQKAIIERVLNGYSMVSYDAALYNCTAEEFSGELEGLKTAMHLCGLEG